MDQEQPADDVQDQNLVDDTIAQAIDDQAAVAADPAAPLIPAPDGVPAEAPHEDTDAPAPAPDPPPLVPTPAAAAPLIDDVPSMAAIEDGKGTQGSDFDLQLPESSDKPADQTPDPSPQPSKDAPPATNLPTLDSTEDLMKVKQQALEQLSPLVSHLDLPAEQKFDTYMEIIRASDDKRLVQPAFDAAQGITDEDKKAQALLDVVNEVNYLTQDHEKK